MSWTNRLMDMLVMGFFCMVVVIIVMLVYYIPSFVSAEIELKRAATKALSGLDLRDEETRRVLRGLFGREEEESGE